MKKRVAGRKRKKEKRYAPKVWSVPYKLSKNSARRKFLSFLILCEAVAIFEFVARDSEEVVPFNFFNLFLTGHNILTLASEREKDKKEIDSGAHC